MNKVTKLNRSFSFLNSFLYIGSLSKRRVANEFPVYLLIDFSSAAVCENKIFVFISIFIYSFYIKFVSILENDTLKDKVLTFHVI